MANLWGPYVEFRIQYMQLLELLDMPLVFPIVNASGRVHPEISNPWNINGKVDSDTCYIEWSRNPQMRLETFSYATSFFQ